MRMAGVNDVGNEKQRNPNGVRLRSVTIGEEERPL